MLSQRVREIKPAATLEMNSRRLELAAGGQRIINFSVGEPDFPTPDFICEAAKRAIDDGWTRYTPVAGVPELRQAIADVTAKSRGVDVSPDQVIVTAGAKQAVSSVLLAQVDRGDEVLVPTPYWVSYPEMIRACEGTPIYVHGDPERAFKVTPSHLEPKVSPRTVGLILNTPNNPTGAVYSAEELAALIEFARANDLWILSDEIYEAFTYGVPFASAYGLDSVDQVILVHGLSKTFAMTGWRIGWAVADPRLIGVLTRFQSHTSSNAVAVSQAAALAALTGPGAEFVDAMHGEFEIRQKAAMEKIAAIPGATAEAPAGSFYLWIGIEELLGQSGGPATAQEFCLAALTEAGVATVPGEAFGMPGRIRLSFACSVEQLEEGLDGLAGYAKRLLGG